MQGVSGAGHRQVVESVERSIPGTLACQSINDDFLITTLRISAARRRKRVECATKVVTGRTLGDDATETALPTASVRGPPSAMV
ncbi:hypothetical protein GS884_26180 [Rhodococcus hoagii]|nr:hypothetical protein [Prescottella equi]